MATETIERRREGEIGTNAHNSRAPADSESLPVPNLRVEGFRGLKELDVPRLSQVTLIAGENGVGKTTLLEAIQVFAARSSVGVLSSVLRSRREVILGVNEEGNPTADLDWESLFWGWYSGSDQRITIGSELADVELRISVVSPLDIDDADVDFFFGSASDSDIIFKVQTKTGPYRYVSTATGPRHRAYRRRQAPYEAGFPKEVAVTRLGPDVVDDDEIADMWDELIDTGGSKRIVLNSLSEMYGKRITDLDMLGVRSGFGRGNRRAKASIVGRDRPVPLKSLGDGAMRIVGNLMAVSRSEIDLVLVDEIENGLHHSIQEQFWRAMIDAAYTNGTQLIATTHSRDCIESFARAAVDNEDMDCSLIRLDDIGDELLVAVYNEQNLSNATESGIEVR